MEILDLSRQLQLPCQHENHNFSRVSKSDQENLIFSLDFHDVQARNGIAAEYLREPIKKSVVLLQGQKCHTINC
jgi:hypothetical protein